MVAALDNVAAELDDVREPNDGAVSPVVGHAKAPSLQPPAEGVLVHVGMKNLRVAIELTQQRPTLGGGGFEYQGDDFGSVAPNQISLRVAVNLALFDCQQLRLTLACDQIVPTLATIAENVLLADHFMALAHEQGVTLIANRDGTVDNNPKAVGSIAITADVVALAEAIGPRIEGQNVRNVINKAAGTESLVISLAQFGRSRWGRIFGHRRDFRRPDPLQTI